MQAVVLSAGLEKGSLRDGGLVDIQVLKVLHGEEVAQGSVVDFGITNAESLEIG